MKRILVLFLHYFACDTAILPQIGYLMATTIDNSLFPDFTWVVRFLAAPKYLRAFLTVPLLFFVITITVDGQILPLANAETHTVRVTDFSFLDATSATTSTIIDEGDTVKWVTEHDYHDVISGVHPNPSGAFRSAILNTGNIFEVTFDRLLLKNFPVQEDTYQYYCEPHVFMGMTGTVKVIRKPKTFNARLRAIETVPFSNAVSSGACTLILNPQETEISIECSSTVANPLGLELRRGALGSLGSSLCFFETASGSCSIGIEDVDLLFDSNLYVSVPSDEFPEGELRGQVLLLGGNQIVSGKVLRLNQQPLEGVLLNDGERTVLSDAQGAFQIIEVPNGVYALQASKPNYLFKAEPGTNPFVVNNSEVQFRSFLGVSIDELKAVDIQVRTVLRELRKIIGNFDQKHAALSKARRILRNLSADPLIDSEFLDLNTGDINSSLSVLRRFKHATANSRRERRAYGKLLDAIAHARKITRAAY